MRELTLNGVELDKSFTFSGGEVQIRLPYIPNPETIIIDTVLNSSDKIMQLILVIDALNYYHTNSYLILNCHYLPYARQDRRCAEFEAHSSNVMVNLLDSLHIGVINVSDVHSEQNLPICFLEQSALNIFTLNKDIVDDIDAIIAPDKGSVDKVSDIAEYFNIPLVIADKKRNPDNGYIENIEIIQGEEFLTPNSNILVIDDICDGGLTFMLLHEHIINIEPNINKVDLYVTHGIFSNGLTKLDGYDTIYTTNSICDIDPVDTINPRLKIIEL